MRTLHEQFGHCKNRDFLRILKPVGAYKGVPVRAGKIHVRGLWPSTASSTTKEGCTPQNVFFQQDSDYEYFFRDGQGTQRASSQCAVQRYPLLLLSVVKKYSQEIDADELHALNEALGGSATSKDIWDTFTREWLLYVGQPTWVFTTTVANFNTTLLEQQNCSVCCIQHPTVLFAGNTAKSNDTVEWSKRRLKKSSFTAALTQYKLWRICST